MSVNMSHAMDQDKVRRYGKLFGSIDFECNDKVSAEVFHQNPNSPVVGTLSIGGKSFNVTLDELKHLEQTCRDAHEVVMKRYRLGMMGSLSR